MIEYKLDGAPSKVCGYRSRRKRRSFSFKPASVRSILRDYAMCKEMSMVDYHLSRMLVAVEEYSVRSIFGQVAVRPQA
jgi:hypothetical protein